ncbi:uncharacterized protein LOC123695719 [Colias croceus]|uniref:uncharacterized protein LOC123695719 n=1 Tax=Colias crocea TaxID=72248 RepID=UPI001E280C5A|nr:uncharacterized protein LOC123695719 [Colias croceus]
MNSNTYKCCAVPQCISTTIKTPNKVFVHVPNNKLIRNKWLKLALRNPNDVVTNSPLYFCEDHFDLPNDMENYMQYHMMKSVSQVRMKPGCMPHKFTCQSDRKSRKSDTTEQPYKGKKRRMLILEECKKEFEEKYIVMKQSGVEEIASISSVQQDVDEVPQLAPRIEDDKKREDFNSLECTLMKIRKNPRSYIGVPFSCFNLVNLIEKQTNIPFDHILLCLKKIKLNNSFRELADDFGIDKTYPGKIFMKNIPILASVMRPFIVPLDKLIKKNLPKAFRHKYNNVTCIIDCLEIEIQKPSNALNQALSWSDYKKSNTIKYLISYTPNGLINYISNGYGGRITDTCIVETSDFSKCLEPNMCIMADGGFEHVEVYLSRIGVKLVRLPSVASGCKLTTAEAQETKQIEYTLRIHEERVIRRIREFNILKSHDCLNLSLVKVLDDIITIACGLINLQDSLIK